MGKIRYSVLSYTIFILVFMVQVSQANSAPVRGGTLIWGRSAKVNTIDPATGVSAESQTAITAVYDTLVRYSDDYDKLEPSLAISWDISKDGKTLVFKLRQGVVFHNGDKFDAQSVVFSFLRQMDSSHPHYPANIGYAKYIFDMVERVYPISQYEVGIQLKTPYAPFLHSLTIPAASIVCPASVKKLGDKFGINPCGTGPFMIEKWDSGERVTLIRNEKFWGDAPFLDRLVYKTIVNSKDRLLELSTGSIQVMDGIGPEALDTISRNNELRFVSTPGLNICFITMNTQSPPFDNVKVRQAVNYAVNKTKIVKLLYQGLAEPAVNPFPPHMWGFNHEITGYGYKPEKAKALLKEAGYPDGFETTLFKLPVPRFYNQLPDKTARLIQANLAKVGIKANISTFKDWKTYRSMLQNGKHQMAFYGWGAEYNDPDYFLYNLLDQDNAVIGKGYNFSFFRNNELHDYIRQAQEVSDQSIREGLYKKAQVIIHQQAPWVPLVHVQQLLGFHKSVHGIILDPSEYYGFEKAWID